MSFSLPESLPNDFMFPTAVVLVGDPQLVCVRVSSRSRVSIGAEIHKQKALCFGFILSYQSERDNGALTVFAMNAVKTEQFQVYRRQLNKQQERSFYLKTALEYNGNEIVVDLKMVD